MLNTFWCHNIRKKSNHFSVLTQIVFYFGAKSLIIWYIFNRRLLLKAHPSQSVWSSITGQSYPRRQVHTPNPTINYRSNRVAGFKWIQFNWRWESSWMPRGSQKMHSGGARRQKSCERLAGAHQWIATKSTSYLRSTPPKKQHTRRHKNAIKMRK